MQLSFLAWAAFLVAQVACVPQGRFQSRAGNPTVHIGQGKYIGYSQDVDNQAVDFFLGMRYAKAPIGDLRFAKPQPLRTLTRTVTATRHRAACLQRLTNGDFSEDCLFLNIIRPSPRSSSARLPVMVFLHGGGFQFGTGNSQNGSRIVAESIEMGASIIFVAINYRIGAFGFLGGSSVLSAAKAGSAVLNAGMWDTRAALEWVQKNIAAFGGDPGRVTLSGQSAGAFITGHNLLANGGNTQGLFHAAIMESGSPGSAGTIRPNHPKLDETFAKISRHVNCPTKPDDLSCLKSVPASDFLEAANKITESFGSEPQKNLMPFMPVEDFQTDGFWFSAPPRDLVNRGQFAKVPIISGCNLDEGTSGAPRNLKTSEEFEEWFKTVAVINTSNTALVNRVLSNLFRLFPDDVTKGSPFYNRPNSVSAGNTNPENPFFEPSTNQFKRAASIYGAWRYIAPHRKFLLQRYAAKSSGIWSYQFAQQDEQVSPHLGVTHASELTYVFGNTADYHSAGFYAPLSKTMQRAYISFINYHDPRSLDNLNWPPFTASGRQALQLKGKEVKVIAETFREDQLSYIKSNEAAQVLSS
ncbi:unnamed protein product [Tilletia controversa]|nr:unnamed protein product [Tilletia controversa]